MTLFIPLGQPPTQKTDITLLITLSNTMAKTYLASKLNLAHSGIRLNHFKLIRINTANILVILVLMFYFMYTAINP